MYWDLMYRPNPWNTCPNCGYCPCCGRSRQTYPSYPWTSSGTSAAEPPTITGEVKPLTVDESKLEEWRKKWEELEGDPVKWEALRSRADDLALARG